MLFEFRLPDIGEGVVEGEVVKWLVKAGDAVREDQPMVEVMTDKATVEIPSPWAGTIVSIDAPEGKLCAVGQIMVRIDSAAKAGASAAAAGGPDSGAAARAAPSASHNVSAASHKNLAAPHTSPAAPQPPAAAPPNGGAARSVRTGKALATPATRKLARDLGIDLAGVGGSGDKGRVTSDDVRAAHGGGRPAAAPATPAYAPSTTPSAAPIARLDGDERVPFRGVRKKIAENMARSKHAAAHFTYVEEADLTELVQVRARARKRAEERGLKLSFLPFIIKACVAGLKKYPIVNSTLDEAAGEIVLRRRYHIGVAAASEQGLLVPVVRDADQKSLFQIARELEEISERARNGKATREELTGSTFTISSLGAIGGVLATPIINHPEVAILGVHKIKQAPVVRDGQIVIRDVGNFFVSLDHRVVDGYEGAQFLQHVIELLSDPTLLFMELV